MIERSQVYPRKFNQRKIGHLTSTTDHKGKLNCIDITAASDVRLHQLSLGSTLGTPLETPLLEALEHAMLMRSTRLHSIQLNKDTSGL